MATPSCRVIRSSRDAPLGAGQGGPDTQVPGCRFGPPALASLPAGSGWWGGGPSGGRLLIISRPDRLDRGQVVARSIVQLAVATTYTQQREIDQACAIASQALDLPADQRIGPISQRAQDLLRELEPWRGRPAVEDLRERVVAS
jgi:hypothetical protein